MPSDVFFICKRCGHCCIDFYGGYCFTVDEDQVVIWEEEAPYLLDWLVDLGYGAYDGWLNPRTGDEVDRCPWLRILKHPRFKQKGAYCLIHDYKPPNCRNYPRSTAYAIATGCQGFNHLPEKTLIDLLQRQLITVLKMVSETMQ